jgi:plastocyanin
MTPQRLTVLLLLLGAILRPVPAVGQAPVRSSVHVIAMVERGPYGIAFEPLRTHAAPGDTVRFLQRGALPHNALFRSVPVGAELGWAIESPMLSTLGATYDLVIDRRFVPGKYHFVCVPHETLGMAGLLYVDVAPSAP